jgi:hypothetical protein
MGLRAQVGGPEALRGLWTSRASNLAGVLAIVVSDSVPHVRGRCILRLPARAKGGDQTRRMR